MIDVSEGARVFLRKSLERVEMIGAAGGSVAVFTAARPSSEESNEDACAVLPYIDGSAALVVCDGAGGTRGGGEAAEITISKLRRSLARGCEAAQPLRAAILDGIEAANRAVLDLGSGAAATLAVAAIDGKAVRPYHVGDTVVLLLGGRGRVKHQSLPHGPVGYAVEAGVLSEAEAMHHEERHLVSNMIGDAEMRIEMGPRIALAPRDTLLLASDGLVDNMYLKEIVAAIHKGPLDKAAALLASQCRRRMVEPADGEPSKEDDLTFLLYRRSAGSSAGPRR